MKHQLPGIPGRITRFLKIISHTPEGRVFILFLFSAFIILSLIVYNLFNNNATGRVMLQVLAINSLGGRGPAVGLCFVSGWNILETYVFNVLLEFLNLFLVYSVFTLSVNHYLEFKWIIRLRKSLEKRAHLYEHLVSRYGFMGVFLFVALPLPFTGPVMGSIIAYFLRFSVKKTLLATIPGCMLSIAGWTGLLSKLSEHKKLFTVVLAALLLMAVFGIIKAAVSLISRKKPAS